MKHSIFKGSLFSAVAALAIGCADNPSSYSILVEQEKFLQTPTKSFNSKVDILWVMDTSGSMEPYQENLAQNFDSFISTFATKGFDFHMAVAGTDAWLREVNFNGSSGSDTYHSSADLYPTRATYDQLGHFRDGDIYNDRPTCTRWNWKRIPDRNRQVYYCGNNSLSFPPDQRSGTYLLTRYTPDILNVFATNIRAGIRGDGHERGLQSLRATLRIKEDGTPGYGGETHTALEQFRRPDAFFSVIFVADEDDQSTRPNGSSYSRSSYRNTFIDMMDTYTQSAPENRRYNVSSIVMTDTRTCYGGAHESASNGTRYMDIAEATKGVVTDICKPDFSEDLTIIAETVVAMVSRFQLSREPIPGTIRVSINGEAISEDPVNGWTYFVDNGAHFVGLNGAAIPAEGDPISITYDPVSVKM